MVDDSDDDGGDVVGSDNVYKESMGLVLVSPSDLYSDEEISVCDNRPSSCSAYMSY